MKDHEVFPQKNWQLPPMFFFLKFLFIMKVAIIHRIMYKKKSGNRSKEDLAKSGYKPKMMCIDS
jgi:hypothetical protein